MHRWHWISIGLFTLLCAGSAGCAIPGIPLSAAGQEINATWEGNVFKLAPGDQIEVRFAQPEQAADWNHTTQVLPNGRASFLGLGEIPVAGMTVDGLKILLTKRYQELGTLVSPSISILVPTLAVRNVVVMGEVQRPGAVPLTGPRMSLLDAVGQAGGPRPYTASLKNILLVRWLHDQNLLRTWKLDARPDQWGSREPILMQPDDVVFVSNTPIDKLDNWVDQYIRRLIPIPTLIPQSALGF